MHLVKSDAYTNAHYLWAKDAFTKLCACKYAYLNMHTSYALTHTYGLRRSSIHTIIHTSKHIYAKARKHVSTPTHIPAHMHSCTHIGAPTHTHTHTLALTHKHLHTRVRER